MRNALAVLLVLLVMVAANVAKGDPLTHPKRLVDGQTVDLSPLFQWWNKHRGQRPLSAWVHVTGTIVGTNAWGWTVNALIEESPAGNGGKRREQAAPAKREKIVLKSPPLADLGQFEMLNAQRKTLNAERDRLSAEAERAGKRARELSGRQGRNRAFRGRLRGLAQESRRWSQVEKDAKAKIKVLDNQIRELDSKLADYPNRNKYMVDCLALKTSLRHLDLPVYNHGGIIQ